MQLFKIFSLIKSFVNLTITIKDKKQIIKHEQWSSLDGLRGLAAIFVVLTHFSGQNVDLIHSIKFANSEIGKAGVYLFFVLSSFLLTSQLLKPQINLKSLLLWKIYFKKRFLRIYPLYIIILLFYLLFWGYTIQKFLAHLFLIQGESCFWTIVVEVKYYLILPIIVFLMLKVFKKNNFYFFTFCLLSCALSGFIWYIQKTITTISILPYLSTFLIGSFAALINTQISNSLWIKKDILKWFLDFLALISVGIVFWLVWFVKDYRTIDSNLSFNWLRFSIPAIYGGLWSIFLISHLWAKGICKTILSNPLLRFIGAISFGIYLWHIPVLGYLNSHLDIAEQLKFIVIFGTTIIIGSLSYFLLERPFILLAARK